MRKTSQTILKEVYPKKLINLGTKKKKFSDIFSPVYSKKEIKKFNTDYYEVPENVDDLAESLDLTQYYYRLIKKALGKIGFNHYQEKIRILDIGCGFGSSTFPLLKLFPEAEIVASELSLSMLGILKEKLEGNQDSDRVALLQLNAEKLEFAEGSFDLVCGAAILHHLISPDKTIKGVAKILKPKGVAIFFEPFEPGTSMMALIYRSILANWRSWFLRPSVKIYFKNLPKVWQKMKNPDKTGCFFTTADNKWIFTKKYFEKLKEKFGFEKLIIYRLDKSKHPFTVLMKSHLENKFAQVPRWVKDLVNEYEDWLSKEVKDELITEGCIVFKKA